ncbi:unnamed protein product [marine sediment metagenome]|uniref:Uncharacterized protein n=1 Tax=marine sediment metagenome TaxID=412755 RepID=X1T826_9ZZZZ
MKALLIEVDFSTGRRAGGIQTKNNPNLMCHGWQDLESTPGLEIRLVMDGNTKPYENIPGITILNGKAAINEAIQANIPTKYAVKDKELLLAHLKEKRISLDTFAGKTLDRVAKDLFAQGLAGIVERKPGLV